MDYASKMQELSQLQHSVRNMTQIINSKETAVSRQETLLRQGQVPNNSAQQLKYNMSNALSPLLQPGNVNDINSIIWPFYFNTDTPDEALGANETFQTGFSVTQEAAFVFMSYTKSVYLAEGEDQNVSYTYLNPDSQPSTPGLTFTMRDGSSSRAFFNTPMDMDLYGNPRFPTKLPRPIMLLPNQVMQISFTNQHASNLYLPKITAFGYRIRIDEAQKLLSLVYA